MLGDEFTDRDYPCSEGFTIDLETATRMLTETTEKPHVRKLVKAFLLEHKDSSWSEEDLVSASIEADRKIEQSNMLADEAKVEHATPGSPASTLDKLWRALRTIRKGNK